MERLVRITLLIDSLNDKEHNAFFKKLLNQFTERRIVNTFVVNLLEKSLKQTDDSYYKQLNKIISNIISSRNKNQSNKIKSTQTSTKTMIDLPSSMISECASYLPFKEIIKFQSCSKFIYYSCASISTTYTQFPSEDWVKKYFENYSPKKFTEFEIKNLNLLYFF